MNKHIISYHIMISYMKVSWSYHINIMTHRLPDEAGQRRWRRDKTFLFFASVGLSVRTAHWRDPWPSD